MYIWPNSHSRGIILLAKGRLRFYGLTQPSVERFYPPPFSLSLSLAVYARLSRNCCLARTLRAQKNRQGQSLNDVAVIPASSSWRSERGLGRRPSATYGSSQGVRRHPDQVGALAILLRDKTNKSATEKTATRAPTVSPFYANLTTWMLKIAAQPNDAKPRPARPRRFLVYSTGAIPEPPRVLRALNSMAMGGTGKDETVLTTKTKRKSLKRRTLRCATCSRRGRRCGIY